MFFKTQGPARFPGSLLDCCEDLNPGPVDLRDALQIEDGGLGQSKEIRFHLSCRVDCERSPDPQDVPVQFEFAAIHKT